MEYPELEGTHRTIRSCSWLCTGQPQIQFSAWFKATKSSSRPAGGLVPCKRTAGKAVLGKAVLGRAPRRDSQPCEVLMSLRMRSWAGFSPTAALCSQVPAPAPCRTSRRSRWGQTGEAWQRAADQCLLERAFFGSNSHVPQQQWPSRYVNTGLILEL